MFRKRFRESRGSFSVKAFEVACVLKASALYQSKVLFVGSSASKTRSSGCLIAITLHAEELAIDSQFSVFKIISNAWHWVVSPPSYIFVL